MTDPRVVVVDGSNLATEGRTTPSLQQLDEAVRAYAAEDPDAEIVVVVDASFEHRVDESERAALEEAELHGEVVSPPAGAIGRGDAFVLRIAERTGAVVLSNDSFQEFHGEHPWLFDEGRLIGGKPVPGVGWIFTPRIPVRGPKSRQATSRARRAAAAEPLSPPAKAAELARAARKAAAKRMAVMPDGSPPKVGDVWQQPGRGEVPPGEPAAGAREGGVAAQAGEAPPGEAPPGEAPPAKKAARKRGAAKKAAGKKAAAAVPLAEEPGAEQRAAEEVAAEQAAAETGAKKGVATKAGAKKEPGKKAAAKKGAGKKAAAKKAAGAKAAAEAAGVAEAAEGPEAPETAPGEVRVAEEVPPTRAAKKAAGKKAPAKAAPVEKEAAKKGPAKAAAKKAPAKKAAAKKAAAKKAAPAKVAAEQAAAGRAPAVERAAAEAPEEEAALGTSRHGTHPSRPREDPALREAIDEATAEAWQPPTEEEGEMVVAPGGGDGTGGATAPGEGRDGRGPRRRRRRATGSAPAVNEPLAFITFVAAHPIGSEVEGEVVSFTSHGAMVDVDLADGGRLHCYIPLTAMAEPPPTKARQVLSRGERRPFVLVGLDPPRRVAELAVPGVASVAPEPAGTRR